MYWLRFLRLALILRRLETECLVTVNYIAGVVFP